MIQVININLGFARRAEEARLSDLTVIPGKGLLLLAWKSVTNLP